MNREDVIRMAREAGFFIQENEIYSMSTQSDHELTEPIERFAALVASTEREACAKVCEQISNEMSNWSAAFEGVTSETKFIRKTGEIISQPFIDAIRARGQA